MPPAKICVIYCDSIVHAAQNWLDMEMIQAEVVILIMNYGPKCTTQILIDGGIKIVHWFKVDTLNNYADWNLSRRNDTAHVFTSTNSMYESS